MDNFQAKLMASFEFANCLAKVAHMCDNDKEQYVGVLQLLKAALDDQIESYSTREGTLSEIMKRESEEADANLTGKYGKDVVDTVEKLSLLSKLMR